ASGIFEAPNGMYNFFFELIPLVTLAAYPYNVDIMLNVYVPDGYSFVKQFFHYENQQIDRNDFVGNINVYIRYDGPIQIFLNIKCHKAYDGAILLVPDRSIMKVQYLG